MTKVANIGFRIKSVRGYTSLNRRAFCEKHRLSENTLKSWEKSDPTIRDNTLKKFTQALKEEGIICSLEWLRTGAGSPPYKLSENVYEGAEKRTPEGHPLAEVEFFLKNNKGAVIFQAPDDAMLPFYDAQDYVGGVVLEDKKKISSGSHAILALHSGEKSIRKVSYDSSLKRYLITSTNPLHQEGQSVLEEKEILEIAEIVWHRNMKS